MAKTNSTEKYSRSPAEASKDIAQEKSTKVTVETPVSLFCVIAEKNVTSRSTCHEKQTEKMGSAEEWHIHMDTKAAVKAAKAAVRDAKASHLAHHVEEAGNTTMTSVSMGTIVLDFEMVTISHTTSMTQGEYHRHEPGITCSPPVPVVPQYTKGEFSLSSCP